MAQATRIGFVGLGIMGKPMAHNLLRAGYALTVNTRTRTRAEELLTQGAVWADSAAAAAASCEVVITMLPDSPDVASVVRGGEGLLAGATSSLLWIDMSTIAPAVARELSLEAAAEGVDCLDAPVSGGERGAIEATLSIMVGGSEEVLERARPILELLGAKIVHIGESGAGQVAKACNQMLAGVGIAAVAEALVLAAKAGVDPSRVREALLGGLASSRVLEVHGERMLTGAYKPGFRTQLHQKDLGIALEIARSVAAGAPLLALSAQLMNALAAAGGSELDHSALVSVYEQLGGCRLREGA